MRISAALHYPADPATVFAMLTDRAFQDRKLGGTGALSWEVEVTTDGDATRITSRRALPTDQVPEAFRAFVGDRLTLTQTETWEPAAPDGTRRGRMVVEVGGTPVRLEATLRLTAEGAGTVEQVEGDLQAKVPLFGGRIEKAAEPAVRAAIDAEERIGQEWLSEHR